MITPIIRLAQAVEEAQEAYAEIEAEELNGHLNRFHQSKALEYAALAEQFAVLSVKHLQNINANKTASPAVVKRRTRVSSNAARSSDPNTWNHAGRQASLAASETEQVSVKGLVRLPKQPIADNSTQHALYQRDVAGHLLYIGHKRG
jgi:hypothetical protein